MVVSGVPAYSELDAVGGWFSRVDHAAFQAVHEHQREVSGDILEIGAFEGRSAIVLGGLLRPGEQLHVCDPFGSDIAAPADNQWENRNEYASLTRTTFDANYARFHATPPEVHQCLSTDLDVPLASFRFVHVDGSHLYDNVVHDAALAHRSLVEDGLVVFDDWRNVYTPGVAAAIWRVEGLVPVLLTNWKLYGSWRPDPYAGIGDTMRRLGCSVTSVPFAAHSVVRASMAPDRVRRLVRAATPPGLVSRSTRLRRFVE